MNSPQSLAESPLTNRFRPIAERVVTILIGAVLVTTLVWTGWLWDLDQVFYDRGISLATVDRPNDVIIVAIDEHSLAAVHAGTGSRWPWPRSLHGELVNRLARAGAKVVFIDILFTESSRVAPDEDAQFANALNNAANVVLPVHLAPIDNTATSNSRQTLVLPTQSLLPHAAALGHTHSRFDSDGILREIALALASGEQRIPHAAVSVLALTGNDITAQLPGQRTQGSTADGWFADFNTRFKFAGPPGHLPRLSYVQLLQMEDAGLARLVQDKFVFVGATAPGMDMIPTPVSGARAMPGVEVNANIFLALRDQRTVQSLARPWVLAISLAFVLLPYAAFASLRPRLVFPLTLIAMLAIAAFSAIGIWANVWFPPMVPIVSLLVVYLIWSSRRLGNAVRFLTYELERLERETRKVEKAPVPTLAQLTEHVALLMPVAEVGLFGLDGECLQRCIVDINGNVTPADADATGSQTQSAERLQWCAALEGGQRELRVTLDADEINLDQSRALVTLAARMARPSDAHAGTATERIEQRIANVRTAAASLTDLRTFVDQSLEQLASGVVVTDALGQVREANSTAAQFLGLPQDAVVGSSILQLLPRLATVETPIRTYLREVQLDGEANIFYARSNADHDLVVYLTPFASAHAEAPFGVIVNMTDISELRASERRRAELLSFISHDLRAPLVSTLALTQIATIKPERLQDGKTVKRIEDNVKKTLTLADDFLHLARAEAVTQSSFGHVCLVTICNAAVSQMAAHAEQKQTTLVLNNTLANGAPTDGGPPQESVGSHFYGDADLIERALVNLISNAIKYSDNGACVTVSLEADGDDIVCAVSDTGIGIPADALATLFDRFTRVDESDHRKRGGAGLGLALVATVAQRHGGEMQVTSVVGEGSKFMMRMPRHAPA